MLVKLGLGSLPGDVRVERKGFTVYFPLTSSSIISALITLMLWIFRRQPPVGLGPYTGTRSV